MDFKPKDVSLVEAIQMSDPLIRQGCNVYQKWTCSLCNSRQSIAEANHFYKTGKCELCGTVTNIEVSGCGILVSGPSDIILKSLLEK